MSEGSAILLFVKQPAPGTVKSRLAAVLGEDASLSLYRCFVPDILDTVERTGCACHIFVHPPDAVPAVASWLGNGHSYRPQWGEDLGERMEQAFRDIFSENVERALLIGSDLPDLPLRLLQEAGEALHRHDAVIGPALDGGYYLIGFRRGRLPSGVFRGMIWSRPDVFERTLRLFRERGTVVHVLPPWRDVDTLGDLNDLMMRNLRTSFASSRTMQYLDRIRDRLSAAEGPHGSL